jgi:hypothetical protein
LYTVRNPDYWRFMLNAACFPVRVVEEARAHRPAGYVITHERPEQHSIEVSESAIPGHAAAMAVLWQLKAEVDGEIQLAGSEANMLVRLGRSLGATPLPRYQWLLRITDMAAFLHKVGPVLERRLATSDCSGLSAEVCINLYRESFLLRFTAGRLERVQPLGFVDASLGADGGDLCIPTEAFVRLVFGYRTLDDLRDAWPDIVVKAQRRHVLDVLFPRMTSCVWMPY